ncbi:MAG: ABC transporter ATP-binding protein [Caryophanon sp.]|nr:ABC transporter ATP-binding protein [Caryophanon sp.]
MKIFGYEPVITKDDLKKKGKKKVDKANDWKDTLYRIWLLLAEQRVLLIVVIGMVVLSSALSLLGPFLIGYMIDQFIVPGQFSGMERFLIGLAVVYVLLSVTTYVQNIWMITIAQQTIYRMRTNVFRHLQSLPIPFFDRRQHGELMSRVTNDIETVSTTLNSSIIQVFSSVLTIVGTFAVMLYLSPLLTLLTMLIIPLMFMALRWITNRTGKLFKLQQQAVGSLNGMIEETISGQKIVKAFSQEEHVIAEFRERSNELRRNGFWALTYSGYIPKVMNFLNNMSFTIIAAVGGMLALKGHVSVGTIVIFTEYSRQFTRPLSDLANQFNTVLSAIAGAERVFAIMDEKADEDAGKEASVLQGNVSFDDVTFRYNAAQQAPTLQHVNFNVTSGQMVALVGATGAGKTTIMQLIARFYDVDEGRVLFDDVDVREYTRESLRSQMAFVLQDPFLFEDTVSNNIRYGRLNATTEDIVDAAKKANAHDFIMKLENGYDTYLSANGDNLSQGQRQLLSIARAFVANPAILLLDEATSSVDTVTELHIQAALEKLMEGRTSFVIAHRLNTIRKADIIFVMQQGQLIEQGSREQLIAYNGVFAGMVSAH